MRLNEQRLREIMERALAAGKDLSDHVHYDKLGQETGLRSEALLHEFPELLDKRMDALGPCSLANHQLQRECETLQDELDRREGRPPRPDPMEVLAPVLAQMPADQVAALRFVNALSQEPAPPAPDATEVFEKAKDYVRSLDEKLADIRKHSAALGEVAREKVRRGWMPQSEIDSREPLLEKNFRVIDAAIQVCRDFLRTAIDEHQKLIRRREDLRAALAQAKGRV